MPKSPSKPKQIGKQASSFLAMFRKQQNNQPSSKKSKTMMQEQHQQSQKSHQQIQSSEQIQDLQNQQNKQNPIIIDDQIMKSQSQFQAEQLFGKLGPISPLVKMIEEPKKNKLNSKEKEKEKKLEKQLKDKIQKNEKKNKKKQKKNQQKRKEQSIIEEEDQDQGKFNKTKSILLKGRLSKKKQEKSMHYSEQMDEQINQSQKKMKMKINDQQSQQQEQKSQNPAKKQRRVTFIDVLPLNTQVQKKWKDPIQNQKKGKFSPEQIHTLSQAVGQFLAINGITIEQFQNVLSNLQKSQKFTRKSKIFALLATSLPNRSPQSCYKYLKRNFNSMNRKGKWSQDQIIQLKSLVQKHGRKWSIISKQLKRTPDNCYDKFRQLGQQNMQQLSKGTWLFRELVQLIQHIQTMTKVKFLDPSISRQLSPTRQQLHNKKQLQQVLHKKYNSKNFIFHNITTLKPYLNISKFQTINQSLIKYQQISTKLKTRNVFECRNKIFQLFQVFFYNDSKQIDQEIVEFLLKNKFQQENQINWKLWKNSLITIEQAKNRFMIMKKMIQGRSVKPFKMILGEMKKKVEEKIGKSIQKGQEKGNNDNNYKKSNYNNKTKLKQDDKNINKQGQVQQKLIKKKNIIIVQEPQSS